MHPGGVTISSDTTPRALELHGGEAGIFFTTKHSIIALMQSAVLVALSLVRLCLVDSRY